MPSDCLPLLSRRGVVASLACLLSGQGEAWGQVPSSAEAMKLGFYLPTLREVPRRDVEVSLRFWLEEMARAVNITLMPVQFYDDLPLMKRDLEAGKINFVVASAMGFAQHFATDMLADGMTGYKSVDEDLLLVARRAASIRTIADLAGKRVALLEGDELTDVHLETLLMKAWGELDWTRIGPVSRETRSGKLVNRLFFNTADAALIYRNGYEAAAALNPQIDQRLEVLENYSFKTRSPFLGLFSSRTALELREKFVKAGMMVNETPRGRQVLQIYQADRMERTAVEELRPYRHLLALHRTLKAAALKKKAVK